MNFFKGRCQMRYEKVYASTAGMQIELPAELADRVKKKSELGQKTSSSVCGRRIC